MLEPLQSDTSYKVTVTPVYSDGQDGLGASAMGSTCKANKHTKCKAHTHPWFIDHRGQCCVSPFSRHKDAAPGLGEYCELMTMNFIAVSRAFICIALISCSFTFLKEIINQSHDKY